MIRFCFWMARLGLFTRRAAAGGAALCLVSADRSATAVESVTVAAAKVAARTGELVMPLRSLPRESPNCPQGVSSHRRPRGHRTTSA
jgi:hypothetical protein